MILLVIMTNSIGILKYRYFIRYFKKKKKKKKKRQFELHDDINS